MARLTRRLLRISLATLVVLVLLAAAGALWARVDLRGSLAQLDGDRQVSGLTAAVSIARDDLGIATISGQSREDVAWASGFVHAQDRFFQMDLGRRRAAGELAELVGARALVVDRQIRIHRFRALAARAVSLMHPDERRVLDAYTAGANAGLAALASPPFEYRLLRQTPRPWTAEDSALVVLSMFVTLQDGDGAYEATLGTMHDVLPQAMFDFLAPRGTDLDSPVIGQAFTMPALPGPDVYDLRSRRGGHPGAPAAPHLRDQTRHLHPTPSAIFAGTRLPDRWSLDEAAHAEAIGSNNWAVSGRLTANGGALVANDMHLGIRVPNTWYRASLHWPDPAHPGEPHRMIGTTLPGVPALVTGSNTYVAWGFTNTYADWSDIVLLETEPGSEDRYRTPEGWRTVEWFDETMRASGRPDEHMRIGWTVWGPLLPPDHRGRRRALHWVAHSAEQLAQTMTPLESARTIEEAFDAVNGLGTPGQNMVVADRSGRIGWTVYGSIPRRVGLDGQLPASWADGPRGWSGWLAPAEYPRLIEPENGRIWTANARVVDGAMLAALGDGSYEVGSRARIIEQRLLAKQQFTPLDFLAMQLDTSAAFLERWRALILRTLTPQAIAASPARQSFRRVVDQGWTGSAAADSAAYRLTRGFRDLVSERVFAFVLAECYEADATFDYTTVRKREGPLWALVTGQPAHLLDPRYATWDAMLIDAVDGVVEQATRDRSGPLDARVWSEVNVTAYRHPLSAAVPFLGRWLDMPLRALPGDLYTPRVQWGANGASERMVVSPGRESEGIMQMPTGQSGHPMSPYYANSHQAWVEGTPTPFLPGRTRHTLRLRP